MKSLYYGVVIFMMFAPLFAFDLKVTEVNYHPLPEGGINDTEFEFIEFKNIGSSNIILDLAQFVNGLVYTFPVGTTVQPGKFVVLCSNQAEFKNRYGFSAFGEFDNQLANNGERITMLSAMGDTLVNFHYNDIAPWPIEADGLGYTLVSVNPNPTGDPNDPAYWRLSTAINGSPGADDGGTGVSHEKQPQVFSNELGQNYPNPFNPTTMIPFQIVKSGLVTLTIYDLLGREVATLVNANLNPGFYQIQWRADDKMSGVFLYRLKSGDFNQVRRLLLIK
jgi:hypothetical protein